MAQRHRVHDGVAELADADLHRAAVPDQEARRERDGVLGGRDRQVRRRHELVVAARVVDHEVERRRGHVGVPEHERHAVVYLPDDRDRRARPLALAHHRDEVRGHVRVGAEARASARTQRDLLRDHVRAFGEDAARDVRVVDAGVGLLRERHAEPGAGLHEELLHAHVRRAAVRPAAVRPTSGSGASPKTFAVIGPTSRRSSSDFGCGLASVRPVRIESSMRGSATARR